MNTNDISQLIEYDRNQYYSVFSNLSDEHEIRNILPSTEANNFLDLINWLIKKIDEDIKEFANMELEYKSNNDLAEVKQELSLLKMKSDICKEKIQVYMNEQAELAANLNSKYRNIIFASRAGTKNYIEHDIDDLDRTYHERIRLCLQKLRNFDDNFDSTKQRHLANNEKLKGIIEMKEFQLRLGYRIIDSDSIFLFLVAGDLKDTNSTLKRRVFIERKEATEKEFLEYKKQFKDPMFKEQIVKKNNDMYDLIMNSVAEKGERKNEI